MTQVWDLETKAPPPTNSSPFGNVVADKWFFFHLSVSVHAELNFHLLLCGCHGKAAKVRWHWIHKMNFGGTKMPCVVVIAPLDAVVTFIVAISVLLLRCLLRIEHHSRWVPLSPLIYSHSIGFPGHSHCLSNLKNVHRKGSLMSQRLKRQRSYRIYKHCESWRCSCLVAQGKTKSSVRLLLPQGHCLSKGESENGIQLSEHHMEHKVDLFV